MFSAQAEMSLRDGNGLTVKQMISALKNAEDYGSTCLERYSFLKCVGTYLKMDPYDDKVKSMIFGILKRCISTDVNRIQFQENSPILLLNQSYDASEKRRKL